MKMHKSKTMWFSVALVIFGSLYDNLPQIQALIDPKYYGIGIIIIGITCAILRFLTTGPIGE